MKKLATLLLAAGMVVASTAPANAVDAKVSGEYRHSFSTGSTFGGDNLEDARHRMRLNVALAASENVAAFVQFQINHAKQYGVSGKHGDTVITTRQMYLDWTVPGTAVKVRMGRQDLGLPTDAFGGNSVLGAGYGNREGIVVTAPVADWLGLTGIWARLGTDGGVKLDENNTDDIYAIAANVKFDGISGAVYGAYATLDAATPTTNSQWNSARPAGAGDAYWVGATATFTAFDPFTLKLSAAYGNFSADAKDGQDESGWNVQAKASYALPFGTAVLGGWYFSGEDKDGEGYMPNAGYFNGTNHFYDGNLSLATSDTGYTQNLGTWAVQAGIEGVSFVENLTHSFHVTYLEGTNDEIWAGKMKNDEGAMTSYLTEEDSAVEFTLNSVYKIYKNLAAHLELAYIINDFDNETAKAEGWTEDNWYASLTFQYKF